MKTKNKNVTFEALQRWRRALEEGICIKSFKITDDGKAFDYELKDESEYNCKDCFAVFCFKSLKWDDDQENDMSKQSKILTPLDLPGECIQIKENDEYLRSYT